jgi:peptidyl-prolyl cis-trans isomerase SurA
LAILAPIPGCAWAKSGTIAPDSTAPVLAPSDFRLSEPTSIVVNDEIISSFDIYNRMKWVIYWSKLKISADILVKVESLARRSLIDERLQLNELKRLGSKQNTVFIVDSKNVEQGINRIAKEKNILGSTLLNNLLDQGIDSSTLYNLVQSKISWDAYIRARYGRTFYISPTALAAEYAKRKSALAETQYLATEIFISSEQVGGDRQADQFASQLWMQIVRDGAAISEIARQFSDSPSAARDGSMGWISPSDMPPSVAKAMLQLNKGQLSTPIPTIGGTYLIYVQEKRGGGENTMVHVKQALVPQSWLLQPTSNAQSQAVMTSLSLRARTCDELAAMAKETGVATVTDLGEVDLTTLNKTIQDVAQSLGDSGVSEVISTPAGLGLIAVCSRRVVSPRIQSEDEIFNELFIKKMETWSKRTTRELRALAYISGE